MNHREEGVHHSSAGRCRDVERRRLAKLGEVDEEHVPVVQHARALREPRDGADDAPLLPRVDRVVDEVEGSCWLKVGSASFSARHNQGFMVAREAPELLKRRLGLCGRALSPWKRQLGLRGAVNTEVQAHSKPAEARSLRR